MLKLNQSGFSHLIVPALVVVIVALVGGRMLTASHADPVASTTADSTSTASAAKGSAILNYTQATPGTASYSSSVPYSFVGTQTVNNVGPGQTLTYQQGVKGDETSCYEVYVSQPKVGTATATVEFTNNNNYVTRSLTSTNTDNLQEVCVAPGTKTNPGFNVKNLTSIKQNTNVEVYQDVLSWTD